MYQAMYVHTLLSYQVESIPNPILQRCAAMGPDLMCKHCGCSWQTHMHVRYFMEHTVEVTMITNTTFIRNNAFTISPGKETLTS